MRIAIPSLLQYAFIEWCWVKPRGQIYVFIYFKLEWGSMYVHISRNMHVT